MMNSKCSEPAGLIAVAVTGMVLASLVIAAGILFTLFSGIISAAFFTSTEPGWGILFVGTAILGLASVAVNVPGLTGFILLLKMKKTGWILTIIYESLLSGVCVYSIIKGYAVLFVPPLIWSVFVVIYLLVNRKYFRSGRE